MTADFLVPVSLHWWNQRGDSRAERENDGRILRMRVVTLVEPYGGFFACLRRL